MALMNRHLTGVETVFLAGDPALEHVSSSLVKEVAAYGGDVSGLVPDAVREPAGAPARPARGRGRAADMDVHDKLAEIIQLVEDARAMPMSASCLVNREEVLGLLDELRALLPEQLQQADVLLSDRDAVVEEGRDAAKRLLDQARAEHDRLVEEQAVVVGARERAATVLSRGQRRVDPAARATPTTTSTASWPSSRSPWTS